LMTKQAEAVLSYELHPGPFLPIGVGGGKTGISLMIPDKAFRKGVRKMLLIVPSGLIAQLWNNDIPFWRSKVPMSYPIHLLAGRTRKDRTMIIKRNRPGLYIMPDSYLSVADTSDMVYGISPEMIIVDEAHGLAKRDSARAKRLQGYIEEKKPEFIPMSGTMTNRSIMDYFFLVRHSLKDDSFLPRSMSQVQEWGTLIDAETTRHDVDTSHWNPGVLSPLIRWAQQRLVNEKLPPGVAGFRRVYAERMATCPGVVSSGGVLEVDSSLLVKNNRIEDAKMIRTPGYDRVLELGKQVDDLMITPNGDELSHSMLKWKWMYQIFGSGFYTELIWPQKEDLASRLKLSNDQAADYLNKSFLHLETTREYDKHLRGWLNDRHIPGLDTPMLVGSSMYHHEDRDVGPGLYAKWQQKQSTSFPELSLLVRPGYTDGFGRLKRAVRLCDFKVAQALEWAREIAAKGMGGIIWVHHIEMGEWMREVLMKAGLPVLHCPAGGIHNERIINPTNSNKIIVASMAAHGQGKNLQHFQHQWFLQWPRSAKLAEQVLGRLHRKGQRADTVIANTANSSAWDDLIFAATLNDALYIHQTTQTPNRLIIADYEPVPRVFPNEVLRQKVENVKVLDPRMVGLYMEKFGTHG